MAGFGSEGRAPCSRHIHARVAQLVRAHRSTIDLRQQPAPRRAARGGAERRRRRGARARAPRVARAREAQAIEDRLKRGELRAIVATSSLELGHRHGRGGPGRADRVAPVASRRAFSASGAPATAWAASRAASSSPSTAAICSPARPRPRACERGEVEETFYPRNPLDVLAQQIVAIVGRRRADHGGRRSSRWSGAPPPSPICPRARLRGRPRHALAAATRPTTSPSCARASPGTARAGASRRAHGSAQAPRRHQRRHHPGPRALRRLHCAADGARPARGRARRGDGLRAARGRGVPPRRLVVARGRDHPRPGGRLARGGRAGQDAVLARRPARARAAFGEAIGALVRASRIPWPANELRAHALAGEGALPRPRRRRRARRVRARAGRAGRARCRATRASSSSGS